MDGIARAMNKIPEAILRSPLHPLMSDKYLLLSFIGRKSGKRYTIPLAYLKENGFFLMTTDSPWWKNLQPRDDAAGVPVLMRIKGREYEGLGAAVTDREEVARVLGALIGAQPGYARHVGLRGIPGRRIDSPEVEAAQGRVVVRVRPTRLHGPSGRPVPTRGARWDGAGDP